MKKVKFDGKTVDLEQKKNPLRSEELVDAAIGGVREFLRTTRGADMFGASAEVLKRGSGERTIGFVVSNRDGTERWYFGMEEE